VLEEAEQGKLGGVAGSSVGHSLKWSGLRLSTKGQGGGWTSHPPPTQIWSLFQAPLGMVRKYKSGSNAGCHVQMETGTELLQSLLATVPTDRSSRGQGAPRGYDRSLLIQVGWVAVVTTLGEDG
jgi:hypothetical protein